MRKNLSDQKFSGGWDYIAINDNKVYVSHGTQVNILDEKTGDSIGIIAGTTGVHGIAFDNDLTSRIYQQRTD